MDHQRGQYWFVYVCCVLLTSLLWHYNGHFYIDTLTHTISSNIIIYLIVWRPPYLLLPKQLLDTEAWTPWDLWSCPLVSCTKTSKSFKSCKLQNATSIFEPDMKKRLSGKDCAPLESVKIMFWLPRNQYKYLVKYNKK